MGSCGAGLMTQKGCCPTGWDGSDRARGLGEFVCGSAGLVHAWPGGADAGDCGRGIAVGVVIGLVSAVDEDRDLLGGVAEIRWLHAPFFRGTGTC